MIFCSKMNFASPRARRACAVSIEIFQHGDVPHLAAGRCWIYRKMNPHPGRAQRRINPRGWRKFLPRRAGFTITAAGDTSPDRPAAKPSTARADVVFKLRAITPDG